MRNRVTRIGGALLAFGLLMAGLATMTASAAYPSGSRSAAGVAGSSDASGPFVSTAVRSDTSPPLRSITPVLSGEGVEGEFPIHPINDVSEQGPGFVDSVVQKVLGPLAIPTPIANFEGMFNHWGGYPPDTSGDVGPNHFVQIVNVGFQIFSKTGTSLYGPATNNVLFAGFGGLCETTNRGDPVGVYDSMADRFVLSWFAFTSSSGPTSQCFAVSATPDPTGPWYRYEFAVGSSFEDYPKVGVWPDAYYMTANTFGGPGGGGNWAMERERMLRGDPTARMVTFRVSGFGLLPSDLDGNPPPPGSPNYYMRRSGNNLLQQYKFHVDWTNPALSTFTGPVNITVATYDTGVGDVPQPGTSATLDTLSDRLMYRLAYRNMGTHEALLVNHTVDSGGDIAGVRWYEIRDPNGNPPTVFQQGTYAPADGTDRWMGSIAMDHQGNIAVGFSASSTTVYPSIRYAGRLATDPPGELSQGEETLIAGTGSQTGSVGRWGDYSQMNVDPVDDCTFWYTTEYIQVTGERTWRTRIGSFKFPGCSPAPLTPAPTSTPGGATATPVPPTPTACAGNVTYTGSITSTDQVQTSRLVSVGLPPSTCATPRSCPGNDTGDTSQHNYDTYNYQNTTGTSQCVTVSVVQGCSNNALTSIAYLGSYDPANKCTNYIADGARGGPNNRYSFTLGAGQTAVVMVYEQNGGIGCETYTLSINPCDAGGPTATPTSPPPTATSTATATATATSAPPTSTAPPATSTATNTPGVATATPTACTLEFADVPPTNTFYPFVRCLACQGIISGYPCGGAGEPCNTNDDPYFRPNAYVTRGQLAKIVSESAGFDEEVPPSTWTFTDVPYGSTFWVWVERLADREVMAGYACGIDPNEPCDDQDRPYFRPNSGATRGQLTKIVSNAAAFSDAVPEAQQTFTDVPPTHTFWLFVERLLMNRPDVMSGYTCGGAGEPCDTENRPYFRPNNPLTRGQTSKIVANTFFPGCNPPRP
ncbi:MAG TPA: S-layer homology domain-containing protein [Chloroflexia bacterium]|nr:S-layer homology domain-containing protein [Chloroflexia bacterium]